ncbi:unnamed protein product [Bursaphelenchus xylophilus]|nr:unnamed protein product [Bursaphelenchus xylophilus]CAG9092046.1 unnamed protein product [Bursaphelenchus xylophilus]
MATMAAREAVRGTEQLLRQTADALRGLQGQSNPYLQRNTQNIQNARGGNVRIIVDGNVVYDGPANGRYDMYTRNGKHIEIYY